MILKLKRITSNPIELIYDAYRICYAKDLNSIELKKHSSIDGKIDFIKPLMANGHCYDEKTEVLTSRGFVKWSEVTHFDKLASVDPNTRKFIGFETPIQLIKQHYSGEMIHFLNNQIDLLVTPNHKIYCSLSNSEYKRKNPKFELKYANEQVLDKYPDLVYKKPLRMIQSSINENLEVKNNDVLYALYGFFIGDGSTGSKNTLRFHLKKERKIKYLMKLCEQLHYNFKESANGNYYVYKDGIGDEFESIFYNNGNKTFPDSFYNMSSNQFTYFLDGLKNSDGSIKRNTFVYTTTSLELLNKLQALCSINNTTLSVSKCQGNCYTLNIGSPRSFAPMFNDSRTPRNVFRENYDGNIYCATVSSGLLIVRRNTKVVLSGNSSPLEHVNITFEISGVSRALLAQITRHRTASFNVQSQRYVNATNFNYVIPSAIENNLKAKEEFIDFMNKSKDFYIYLQEEYGIKNEDSRAVLPNATDCNMIVTFDLHNFRNFYGLRSCKHAQEEIRLLAEKMMELVKEHIPFADYKSKRCSRICNECFKRGE
jgi:thymidylate synthase (FAD)